MTGLLRKDLLLLAKALRAFALFAVVFAVLSFSQSNGEDMGAAVGSYFFIMIVIMQVFTLSSDEQARWLRLEKALPVTPFQAVLSKYLMSLLGAVLGMIVFLLFCIRDIMAGNFMEPLFAAAGLAAAALFLAAVEFPLLYRFGSNSGRFVFFGVAIVVVAVVWAGQMAGPMAAMPLEAVIGWFSANRTLLLALGFSIPVLAFVGSYFLSVSIYRKKEW